MSALPPKADIQGYDPDHLDLVPSLLLRVLEGKESRQAISLRLSMQ